MVQATSGGNKKRRDDGAARKRYTSEHHLEKNKVRHIMKHTASHKGKPMTKTLATKVWRDARKRGV